MKIENLCWLTTQHRRRRRSDHGYGTAAAFRRDRWSGAGRFVAASLVLAGLAWLTLVNADLWRMRADT